MLLRRKIHASSIAEVVIALSVIALCFGVASLVFIRSTMVATSFEDVRIQTEIQSAIWEQLYDAGAELDIEAVQILSEVDEEQAELIVDTYVGRTDKVIWQQQRLIVE